MSYRIEAQVKDGDRVTVVTESRERTLLYAATLLKNPSYTTVLVLVGNDVYETPNIGKIP